MAPVTSQRLKLLKLYNTKELDSLGDKVVSWCERVTNMKIDLILIFPCLENGLVLRSISEGRIIKQLYIHRQKNF